MQKHTAIQLLGGSITAAAQAIGTTYQAVYKWPDTLTARIEDRVYAAVMRMNHPAKKEVKGNAFTSKGPALSIKPTPISKKLATRVNKEDHIGGGLTNSEKAPR